MCLWYLTGVGCGVGVCGQVCDRPLSTPKGGTREYRNGPWYKTVFGKKQGDRLGEKKKYGHGPYADKKSRFTTIEQNVSAIRKFTTMP